MRFAAIWRGFEGALLTHLALEEELLLPAFDQATEGVAPNQLPHVVRADHLRIRSLLDRVRIDPTDVREVTERAERLALLLQILDHHDRREAAGMFAALERTSSTDQQRRWLKAFAERKGAPPPELPPLPAPPPWSDDLGAPIDRLAAALSQDGDPTAALSDLPTLPGSNGERALLGLRRRIEACRAAPTLEARRDRLVDALDAVRRWRAVAISLRPRTSPPRTGPSPVRS